MAAALEMVSTMTFIETARPLVEDVLRKHGLATEGETIGEGSQRFFRYRFTYRSIPHNIELATDSPWMYAGEIRFECYLRPEWRNFQTLAEGFVKRLDRYLSGGPWAGQDEAGPLWRSIKRVFELKPSSHSR